MAVYKDTLLIATRANNAQNNTFGKFFKSYIKGARIIRAEQVTPFYTELDFEFVYKGETYRLFEKVTGEHSAKGTYIIERIQY